MLSLEITLKSQWKLFTTKQTFWWSFCKSIRMFFTTFWCNKRWSELWGFPGSAVVKNLPANAGDVGDMGSNPGLGSSPERKWQPPPVFLPGEFHEKKSLVDYNPRDHKESDMIEHAHMRLTLWMTWITDCWALLKQAKKHICFPYLPFGSCSVLINDGSWKCKKWHELWLFFKISLPRKVIFILERKLTWLTMFAFRWWVSFSCIECSFHAFEAMGSCTFWMKRISTDDDFGEWKRWMVI